MNLASVFHALGWATLVMAGAMGFTVLGALAMVEFDAAWSFTLSAALTGFVAGAMILSTRGSLGGFEKRESYLLVVLIWPLLAVLGAVPIYLSEPALGAFASIFEAVSGITTTGATLLEVPEEAPATVLLWRAMLQWLGGFLTIVLVVVVMTYLGLGGLEIFQNVIPSGEGVSLLERLLQTAKDLALAYFSFTFVCMVALWIAGMPGFDALCHALSTISTGGFSTRSDGLAAFANPLVEVVIALFMLLGAMNFTLHWGLLQGRWYVYRRNREIRYLLLIVLLGVLMGLLFAARNQGLDGPRDLWHTGFTVISMISTTGYVNSDEIAGLGLPVLFFAVLIIIGGTTGSTAGGLKLMRLSILLKQALRELRRLSHPHGVVGFKFGRQRLSENVIGGVWALFLLFILVFAVLAMLISLSGVATETAMLAGLAALTNAGPVLAVADGGGYGALPESAQFWLAIAMILGRIELLALFTLVNPAYWRN